jgi:hypothetical protein
MHYYYSALAIPPSLLPSMRHTQALDEISYFAVCQAREKLKSWYDRVVNAYLRSEHNVADATRGCRRQDKTN